MNVLMLAVLLIIGSGIGFALVRGANRKVLRQPVVIENRRILNRRKHR